MIQLIHDTEIERRVLGAMLFSDTGFDVGRELHSNDFTMTSHRRIFAHMLTMHEKGLAVDFSTLLSTLMERNEVESVGGAGYVCELTEGLPRNFNPHSYVQILRKKSAGRQIVSTCMAAIDSLGDGEDPADVAAKLQGELVTSSLNMAYGQPESIRE